MNSFLRRASAKTSHILGEQMKKELACQVQDIPEIIQNALIKYGARKKINHRGYLRYFKLLTIKELKDDLKQDEFLFLIDHSNSYLIQSHDGKTIITMGKYLNH